MQEQTPTSNRPRVSWETRIALLEQRQDHQEERQDQQELNMVDLAKKVDDRFDKLEAHVVELKNKNPIMDFIKEKWQIVTFLGILLFGQPSAEALKIIAKVLGLGTVG